MESTVLAVPARHAAADHAAQAHLGIATAAAITAIAPLAPVAAVAGPVAGVAGSVAASAGVGQVALAAGSEEVQVLGSMPSDA